MQLSSDGEAMVFHDEDSKEKIEQLVASGIGTGPVTPFQSLVESGDPAVVAHALAKVDGVRSSVATAEWRRERRSACRVPERMTS